MTELGNLLNTWSQGELRPITVQHSVPTRTIKEAGIALLAVGLIIVFAAYMLRKSNA